MEVWIQIKHEKTNTEYGFRSFAFIFNEMYISCPAEIFPLETSNIYLCSAAVIKPPACPCTPWTTDAFDRCCLRSDIIWLIFQLFCFLCASPTQRHRLSVCVIIWESEWENEIKTEGLCVCKHGCVNVSQCQWEFNYLGVCVVGGL